LNLNAKETGGGRSNRRGNKTAVEGSGGMQWSKLLGATERLLWFLDGKEGRRA